MTNVKLAMEYAAKIEREAIKNGTSELGPPFDKIYAKQEWPTKIFGPNLVEILNAAGFYKKKEWVDLTDEEINSIDFPESGTATMRDFIRIIEAKLREKNGG